MAPTDERFSANHRGAAQPDHRLVLQPEFISIEGLGEIVDQVYLARRLLAEVEPGRRITNLVYMGMGEPLHNYDAVMKALRILADEHGLAVHPRRVTLSTVGVLPALERLATEPLMPNLAISLHATTEDQRDQLVPINRKYGLKELLDACRRFPVKRRERITFEYVMLKDVNDTDEDARRLVRLLNGIKAKVNLLPLNEAAGIPFERPSDERVNRFAQILADHQGAALVSVRTCGFHDHENPDDPLLKGRIVIR